MAYSHVVIGGRAPAEGPALEVKNMFDPSEGGYALDASGSHGLQVGRDNEQVNQFIGTYVQNQTVDRSSFGSLTLTESGQRTTLSDTPPSSVA
jgi:hypothetical protein